MREVKFKQMGALLVPEEVAEEIGLGCDRCDDHELIPTNQVDHPISGILSKFRDKHRGHGKLVTLEKRRGELVVTGELPGLQ